MRPTGPSRRELRAQAKAMKKRMRAQVAEQRKAAAQGPYAQEQRKRRRRRLLMLLLFFLLLMLCCIPDCSCVPPPEEPEGVGETGPAVPEEPEVPELVIPPPDLTGKVKKRPRPKLETKPPQDLAWVPQFRLQVAARSSRLAECFVGVEQPGTLKWTTSVEPGAGTVSEHVIEPMLTSQELTRKQLACVLNVLENPPYKLDVSEAERDTPVRVGVGIEF